MARFLRLLLLAAVLLGLFCETEAYDFCVGGKNGWVLKPAESYSSWAGRMRFQVNDKLVFQYNKDEDSVLLVKEEDYDSCNTNNPIKKFDDGDTVFTLDRSGPFFFISGASGHCGQGQKLAVVVMAIRTKPNPPPTPSPSPSPSPTEAEAPASAPAITPSPSSSSAATPLRRSILGASALMFGAIFCL